jgi:hypothetical protein
MVAAGEVNWFGKNISLFASQKYERYKRICLRSHAEVWDGIAASRVNV